MEKNIYVIHETDEWLIPLRRSFEKIKAPFKEWHMDKENFDFKKNIFLLFLKIILSVSVIYIL